MTQASPTIDLSSCDREPIRTPGSIQPHGCVLALSPQGVIVQVSDNIERYLGMAPVAALGRALADVIGSDAAAQLAPELPLAAERPSFAATVRLARGAFDVLMHRYDSLLMLEFEAVTRAGAADFRHLYPLVGNFLQQLNDTDTIETMSARAADEIRTVTGFNRVLVYQFDGEGHGHVLAESGDGNLPSYLGQRFPATDIPRQARELYVSNRIRLIGDADYTPSQLVPRDNPLTGAPNDLSFAALRSVSPVHLQYMRNMGTLASMSVSLMVKGRLWGLISCHNATPCQLTFDKRTACEQLGQILALRIESREVHDELQFRLEVRRIMVSVLAGLTQGANFIENMGNVFPELLQFARAGGAAIIVDDRIVGYGDTPDEPQLRELISWLQVKPHYDVYYTDRLGAEFAPAGAYRQSASGLLAMPISRIHKHYLLWFRPEFVYTIDWAGNPHAKDAAAGSPTQLSPRTSFDSWRETVHGTSAPWHPGEIEMALEFRTALLGIALERAEQMAELAEELGRANKELEAFSYSVSHDLRAPLRHIVGFSDLLLETAGSGPPEKQHRFLTNIKESARLAGKLVDDLLSFSQMGRASLRPVEVDMNELVRSCIEKLSLDTGSRRIDWHVGDLPAIAADPAFIQLALYNLLANAVKFTGTRDPAVISVDGRRDAAATVFTVADNGVGFNMDYVHKLFGVFQRLHRMEDFQGTGIGLANVRRIVERHGGTVTAFSAPGQGATFTFSIPHTS
ncbi:GAF domain-containing protein [Massilia dura]|uniref:histidine kinase n=1 Tax=Pseudoduganella dura TaxID=321982 RepID=A0A6I3XFP6_9BURK|nr:ATP-binding protein [Pseudoduganella dura]MUI15229.1 GAF domain-containing protein [Pseudoduganella dura]GGY06792.1 histidine kinase [Pseudoduganella dura]